MALTTLDKKPIDTARTPWPQTRPTVGCWHVACSSSTRQRKDSDPGCRIPVMPIVLGVNTSISKGVTDGRDGCIPQGSGRV